MNQRLDWSRDGADWPNRASSRFVTAGGLDWHVQQSGQGPALLMLHGTGASTHSWRGLLPLLARDFTVIAPDLPGHGFTAMPPPTGLSLPGMATLITALVTTLGVVPIGAVGHSAGAAVLIRMSLDGQLQSLQRLVSINGALFPFEGMAGRFFSPIAKALALNPFVPRVFAWRAANKPTVARVLADTGSKIGAPYLEDYARLFQSPGHVAAALGMMANWDLKPLAADLPRLAAPLTLIAASDDRAVSADDAFRAQKLLPPSQVEYVRGLGHLAHEEDPALIADLILRAMGRATVRMKAHEA
jgi:magnesium chelatase accessory protein